eukprot:scaffold12.g8252.t1
MRHPTRNRAARSRACWVRWAEHRSVDRYMAHIRGVVQSHIARGLIRPLLYVAGLSAAVYNRWIKGTETWEGVTNRSRDTVRQLITYLACQGSDCVSSMTRADSCAASWDEPDAGDTYKAFGMSVAARRPATCIRDCDACLSPCPNSRPRKASRTAHAAAARASSVSDSCDCGGCGASSSDADHVCHCRGAAAAADAPTLTQRLPDCDTCTVGAGCSSSRGSLPWPLALSVVKWVLAYAHSLKAQVTQHSRLEVELMDVLTEEELQLLLDAHHRRAPVCQWPGPSFALSVLSELLAVAPLRESNRSRIDENLTFFEDAVGTCERILRTPIPLSYTRHTSRFLVMWLGLLPLGLWPTCGLGTIPLAVVIALLLLGIEEIGVQIEEPFGILPLEDLCEELEGDLYALLEEAPAAKKTAAAAAMVAAGAAASSAAGGRKGDAGGWEPALGSGDEGDEAPLLNSAAPFAQPAGARRSVAVCGVRAR